MKGEGMMRWVLVLVLVLTLSLCGVPVSATDHIVGANRGWNPGINYTLWSNNQTFFVGDLISFRYQKTQYNVFEVNQTGYDNCTTQGAIGNWSSGKDFITLKKAQRYYFICGNGQCFNGMKVSILVHPLPPPPPAHPPHASAHKSAAPRLHLPALLSSLSSFVWLAWNHI
ncbi:early nodulin-like protein 17 [Arachis hypogaea]|uniref:early nodulin-like protein 17 n=1 Tax=Arachis hypogaea TaxID=3818 RepID=UPI000DED1D47|nr:lamin-like protein [Arachis hypogaea]XP_025671420.1 lamin-like protein [Arachis hypogaea]